MHPRRKGYTATNKCVVHIAGEENVYDLLDMGHSASICLIHREPFHLVSTNQSQYFSKEALRPTHTYDTDNVHSILNTKKIRVVRMFVRKNKHEHKAVTFSFKRDSAHVFLCT